MAYPPTTGAPLNLYVPAFDYGVNPGDSTTYDVVLNDNFVALNNFASSVVVYAPTASQTVVQPAATFFNLNSPLVYGAPAAIRFGTAASAWDTSLSRTAAGNLSFDTNAVGNGLGTASAAVFNAGTGFQVGGAAPNNYVLVGNGTSYVPSATLPVNYQVMQSAGSSLTSRASLNFLARFALTDNAGANSTAVDLAASGVSAGSYVAANLTVDTYGRITAASNSGLSRTTNANGSYIQFPDGSLLQWGTAPSFGGGGTGSHTFPHAFTTSATVTLTVSNAANNIVVTLSGNPGTNAFSYSVAGMVHVGGSGSNPTGSETVQWIATGW